MATPAASQARSHYTRQRQIVTAAVVAVRGLLKRGRPLAEVVNTVAAYQYASATASVSTVAAWADSPTPLAAPSAFAGVSSHGFAISEPIVATIDKVVPAPAEPLPDNWWDSQIEGQLGDILAEIDRLVASEVADAGRSASQAEIVARPNWTNYVRMLNPPSCPRCAILAGRIYRDLEEFKRHPLCDCVMIPVTDWQDAHDKGLTSSAQDLFDRGQLHGLSKADEQAIRDGADIAQVVNAHRGMTTTDVFGRRVKATTAGTTKRAAWRRANPTRLVRLRPEAIYRFATDREDAIRLLKLYGYIS